MIRIGAISLLCAAAALAQNNPEKLTIPLHDPSRPAQIRLHLLLGSVTVKGADIGNVQVEARSPNVRPPGAEGMKRLEMSDSALDVVEDNNIVTIKTMPWRSVDLFLTVPRHSSLQLKLVAGGNLSVEGLDGEIDADDLNGSITLRHISGAVIAHSLNGQIQATFDRIDPSKPTSFSTMNGNIDVTLPDNVSATLRLKTDNGGIYSDFDIKLTSGGHIINEASGGGMHHIWFDRALTGTINGGGPEFQFTSFNGQIFIRRKK